MGLSRLPVAVRWIGAIVLGIAVLAIIVSFFRDADEVHGTSFASFMDSAKAGDFERIEVSGRTVTGVSPTGDELEAKIGGSTDVALLLEMNDVPVGVDGVDLVYNDASSTGAWFAIAFNAFVFIVLAIVMYFAVSRGVAAGFRRAEASRNEHAVTID